MGGQAKVSNEKKVDASTAIKLKKSNLRRLINAKYAEMADQEKLDAIRELEHQLEEGYIPGTVDWDALIKKAKDA